MLRVLKGGNNLSFRAVKPSTLGERELNFCVRDGNRWILSSIVTAMVYETLTGKHIGIITARFPPNGYISDSLFRELSARRLTTEQRRIIQNAIQKTDS